MFTIEQLEGFVAVAEELHFGRAARRLHITQPPLSRRVQQLEEQVGVDLLDRDRRGVRLTPAGRGFLADARRILGLAEQATLSARRVPRGEKGTVTIGFTAAIAYTRLDRVVARAAERLPDVDLVLREMVTAAQVAALRAGAIDVGMLRPPVGGNDLRSRRLFAEPLVGAFPTGHRLAVRTGGPALADLDGEPMIGYSPAEARYFHDLLIRVLAPAGVAPDFVQHVTQIHTVLALVSAGLGVALVPAGATRLHFDGVRLRPLTDLPDELVAVDAAWRRDNDNPVLRALLAVIDPAG